MSIIHNERIKLLARALNTVAVASVVAALIAPAVSLLLSGAATPGGGWWIAISLAWLVAGAVLHLAAQRVLGRLTP